VRNEVLVDECTCARLDCEDLGGEGDVHEVSVSA
jgi:hypothetical protein